MPVCQKNFHKPADCDGAERCGEAPTLWKVVIRTDEADGPAGSQLPEKCGRPLNGSTDEARKKGEIQEKKEKVSLRTDPASADIGQIRDPLEQVVGNPDLGGQQFCRRCEREERSAGVEEGGMGYQYFVKSKQNGQEQDADGRGEIMPGVHSSFAGKETECPDQNRNTEDARDGFGIEMQQENETQREQKIGTEPTGAGRQEVAEQDRAGKKQR